MKSNTINIVSACVIMWMLVISFISCTNNAERDDPIPPTKQFQMIQEEYPEASEVLTSLFIIIENKLLPFDSDSTQNFKIVWNCVQNAWYNHQYSSTDEKCPLEEKMAYELLGSALNLPHPVLQPCNEKCFKGSAPPQVQAQCFRECIRELTQNADPLPPSQVFKEIQSNPKYAEAVKLLNGLLLSFADASQPSKNLVLARDCAMESWFNHSFNGLDCPIENQLATNLLTSFKCASPTLPKIPKVEKCCEECNRFLDGTAEGDFQFRKCVSACLIR